MTDDPTLTADEVQLTEDTLLFRTSGWVSSVNPKMVHTVLSPTVFPTNTLGLFIEAYDNNGDADPNITALSSSYIVTPTAYCSTLSSLTSDLAINVDHANASGNVSASALFSRDVSLFASLSATQCPSKEQLLESFYDKTYVDTNLVSVETFATQASFLNLSTTDTTNASIETAVTGGLFNHTDFVTYSNVSTVIDTYELKTTVDVDTMITSAFDNYDFTAFVTLNNLYTLLDVYNTSNAIPNEMRVGELIANFISGNTDSSGFATTVYVDQGVANLSNTLSNDYTTTATLETTYATTTYVSDQIALLGTLNSNIDGATATQIMLNLAAIDELRNTTYDRTYVNENFVSTSNNYVTLDTVTNLINMGGNSSGGVNDTEVNTLIYAALNDVPDGYTTYALLPHINSLQSNISSEIDAKLALSLFDYVSKLSLDAHLNTYTTTVLDPRISTFVNSTDVTLMVDVALATYDTSSVVDSKLSGFLDTTSIDALVQTALDTYTTVRLPSEVSTMHYLNETDLGSYLSTNEYQTHTDVVSSIQAFQSTTLPTLGYTTTVELTAALNTYTTTTLQAQLTESLDAYLTTSELELLNLVTFSEMSAHVATAIGSKVSADTMTNSINSALNTYTISVLDTRLDTLDVSSHVSSYINADASNVVLNKVSSFLYNNELNAGLTSALTQMSYVTISQVDSKLAALQFVAYPHLQTNYYTKDELFVNTNAMIPAWLSQNEYVTKTYVDDEIGEQVDASFNRTKVYVLEQLQTFEGGGGSGDITEEYLLLNYLTRNTWQQWVNSEALTTSDVQGLINSTFSSLTSDFNALESQVGTLSQQTINTQTDVVRLESNLATLSNVHALTESSVTMLTSNVTNAVWSNIVELHDRDGNLSTQLTTLQAELGLTNANVTTQHESLTTLINDTSSSLEGNLANVQLDLENLIATSANVELLSDHFVSLSTYEQHISNCDDDCGVPIVNLFQYNLNQAIIRVDLTNADDDTFVYDAGTFKFNHPFCTVDGQALAAGQTLLIRNMGTLNGVYTVASIDTANVVTCAQATTLVTNQVISVMTIAEPNGLTMNGSNFVVGAPNTEFIQLTYTNYGTMGYQNASNVSISGGVIEADRLTANSVTLLVLYRFQHLDETLETILDENKPPAFHHLRAQVASSASLNSTARDDAACAQRMERWVATVAKTKEPKTCFVWGMPRDGRSLRPFWKAGEHSPCERRDSRFSATSDLGRVHKDPGCGTW